METINSTEYWDSRFKSGDWTANGGPDQSVFFSKVAYFAMPAFLKKELTRNNWTVTDIGCATGEGTSYLAKNFPNCHFIGQDFSPEAIQYASAQFTHCEFTVANIHDDIANADVIFSSNTLEHLKNPALLMKKMCNAASKYVVLLLPLEDPLDIPEHVNIFSLDFFPVRTGHFYLESYTIVDCRNMENSRWPGKQILLVYTNSQYRPENMTLQDIHENYSSLEKKMLEEATKKIWEQEGRIHEVTNLCNWRDHLLEESNKQLDEKSQALLQAEACLEEKNQALLQAEINNDLLKRENAALLEKNDKDIISANHKAKFNQEHVSQISQLQMQLMSQTEMSEKQRVYLAENHKTICDVHQIISNVRNSRLYKLSVLIKRFMQQFVRGNRAERRDFMRWALAKLRKKSAGRPLYEFDMLYSANYWLLHQATLNNQAHDEIHVGDYSYNIMKNNRQIFIFASVPYYDVGGGQRSAQLANVFNAMGYEVHYIYGFDSSESKREQMFVPAIKHKHIDKYSLNELKFDMREDALFIFEIPYSKFVPFLDYANQNGCPTLYEHIDNWDSSLGCLFYNKDDFEKFIHDSKHITVTARVLGEKIEEAGRTDYIYSANAVDSALFEPSKTYQMPSDLVRGKQTLLYFGSLWGEWFDWDLVVHVANNCDCEINLIGDYAPIQDKIQTLPKNIHFLGLKKHDDLPAYLHYSDITLLPFKNSIIGKYVSPLKIFEYIAMNKPVLATPLDDIIGYPNVVLSEDKEVWAKTVNEGIKAIDATVFTAQNSWYARCNQILDHVGRGNVTYPPISIIVLNRNNANVIFRCVDSLLTFGKAYDCEVIVVDNDSTDGSYEQLAEKYGDRIKLIKNSKNGCSSGRNLGVKNASHDMLFFLDSDQWIIGDHFLDAALDLMLQNDNLGTVSWNAGWFEKNALYGPIVDYLPNRAIKHPSIICRTDVAYLATSGLLIPKKIFEEIDGFDEFYDPTCFEDTDLSLKVRYAGYEIGYCPYMAVMHLPHQTTQSGSTKHQELMKRNGDYFEEKWKALRPELLEYHLNN